MFLVLLTRHQRKSQLGRLIDDATTLPPRGATFGGQGTPIAAPRRSAAVVSAALPLISDLLISDISRNGLVS